MSRLIVLLVVLLCYQFLLQCTDSQSKEVNLDIESQIKRLNKSWTKNIQILFAPFYNKASGQGTSKTNRSSNIVSKVEKCPNGTIFTHRLAKADLVREGHILDVKQTKVTNRPHTFLAIARTKVGPVKYAGGGGYFSTHNPKAVGQQYSATRIRLQAGTDSIEAGWRVDPKLYGDQLTHLFVRTDAGKSHCFNTRCPGYIHTDPDFPVDGYFSNISKPGGPVYRIAVFIKRDKETGNWNRIVGKDFQVIGHWPSNIFKTGLVDRVEWGGAVYSPPGFPLPPMGSSNLPIGDPAYDGYISQTQVVNERGEAVDASYIETYADNSNLYSVIDAGYKNKHFRHLILYGGSGHRA